MAGPTLQRLRRIRRADNLDDQKTPGAIQDAPSSSVTEEDFQTFYLSRLREIIFGKPGVGPVRHWFDDFGSLGILSLASASQRKIGVHFAGVVDGINRTFQLPDKFVRGNGNSLNVYHNGRRLLEAPTPDLRLGDFYCSESAGTGTGFDTINLLSFTPSVQSVLVADYQVVS